MPIEDTPQQCENFLYLILFKYAYRKKIVHVF